MNAAVPEALRGAFRVRDILRDAVELRDLMDGSRAAVNYLRRLGLPRETVLPPRTFYRHPYLYHWASGARRGATAFPALISVAEDGPERALEATFLTAHGEVAALREPRLRAGAANGACAKLRAAPDAYGRLWLCQHLEDAVRVLASPHCTGDAVWHGFSQPNLLRVNLPHGVTHVHLVLRGGATDMHRRLARGLHEQGAFVLRMDGGDIR